MRPCPAPPRARLACCDRTTAPLDIRLFLLSQLCESGGARKVDSAHTVCSNMRQARQLPASATWAIWKTVIARSIQMSVRVRSPLQLGIEAVEEQVVFRTNLRLRQSSLEPGCRERRSAGRTAPGANQASPVKERNTAPAARNKSRGPGRASDHPSCRSY